MVRRRSRRHAEPRARAGGVLRAAHGSVVVARRPRQAACCLALATLTKQSALFVAPFLAAGLPDRRLAAIAGVRRGARGRRRRRRGVARLTAADGSASACSRCRARTRSSGSSCAASGSTTCSAPSAWRSRSAPSTSSSAAGRNGARLLCIDGAFVIGLIVTAWVLRVHVGSYEERAHPGVPRGQPRVRARARRPVRAARRRGSGAGAARRALRGVPVRPRSSSRCSTSRGVRSRARATSRPASSWSKPTPRPRRRVDPEPSVPGRAGGQARPRARAGDGRRDAPGRRHRSTAHSSTRCARRCASTSTRSSCSTATAGPRTRRNRPTS